MANAACNSASICAISVRSVAAKSSLRNSSTCCSMILLACALLRKMRLRPRQTRRIKERGTRPRRWGVKIFCGACGKWCQDCLETPEKSVATVLEAARSLPDHGPLPSRNCSFPPNLLPSSGRKNPAPASGAGAVLGLITGVPDEGQGVLVILSGAKAWCHRRRDFRKPSTARNPGRNSMT